MRSPFRPKIWLRKALTIFVQLQFFYLPGVFVGADDSPVLFPDIRQIEEFVEDRGTGQLTPVRGSYSWFLCQSPVSALPRNDNCPDETSVVIHTRQQTFNLNIANLTDEGEPAPFDQALEFEIEAGILNATAGEELPINLTRRGNVLTFPIQGLSSDGTLIIHASTSNWSRQVEIRRDTIPPRIYRSFCNISYSTEDDENEESSRIHFHIEFSEEIYVNENANARCPRPRRLRNEYDAVNLLDDSQACFFDVSTMDIADVFEVEGINPMRSIVRRSIPVTGRSLVDIYVHLSSRTDTNVTLNVQEGTLMDKAGNPLDGSMIISSASCQPEDDDGEALSLSPMIEDDEASSPSPEGGDDGSSRSSLVAGEENDSKTNISCMWKPFSANPIGELFSIMTASSVVMSLAASMISSSLGSNTNPGAMKLLGYSQKLYMTGRLAVANMPLTYRNFTDQFDWSMFDRGRTTIDCKIPEEERQTRRLLQFEAGTNILDQNERIAQENLDHFNRVIFWVPLLFVILLFGHAFALLIFFGRKRDIPVFFTVPRLEIMFGYFCVPAIVMSSTGLYEGNGRDGLLATWMLIAFPASFLCWNVSVIWNNFVSPPLSEMKAQMFIEIGEHYPHDSSYYRKAYAFLSRLRKGQLTGAPQAGLPPGAPQEIEMAAFAPGPSGANVPPVDPLSLAGIRNLGEQDDEDDDSETTTPTSYTRPHTISPSTSVASTSLEAFSNCFQCVSGFFNVPFLNLLLGRRRHSAYWVGMRSEGRTFLSKYGYLFEDYRGPPVIREEASYFFDPVAGTVNRGMLVLADDINSVKLPCISKRTCRLYLFHFHLFMKMLELIKLVVLACLVGSIGEDRFFGDDRSVENDRNSTAEMICLFTLSLLLIILIRTSKPFLDRFDMAVALLVEFADFLVYVSLFIITRNDHYPNNFAEKVGVFMIVVQCSALSFLIVRYAFATMYVTITCVAYHHQRSATKFSKVVDRVIWTYMPHYLEHKYFDRWMMKALHKGLYNRRLGSSELPRSVVMRNLARNIYRSVISIFLLGRTENR